MKIKKFIICLAIFAGAAFVGIGVARTYFPLKYERAIEECAKECGILRSHPQKTINTVLNALDKSPLFTKSYIFADINGSRRKYRCFSISKKAEN